MIFPFLSNFGRIWANLMTASPHGWRNSEKFSINMFLTWCTFSMVSFITFPIPSQNLWRGVGGMRPPPPALSPKKPSLNRVKVENVGEKKKERLFICRKWRFTSFSTNGMSSFFIRATRSAPWVTDFRILLLACRYDILFPSGLGRHSPYHKFEFHTQS